MSNLEIYTIKSIFRADQPLLPESASSLMSRSPPGLSRPARLGGGGTVRTAFIVAIPFGQQQLSINIAPALRADHGDGQVGEVDLGGQWPVGGVRGEDGGGEPGEKR